MLASSCSKYKYETVSGDPLKTRIYTLPNGLKVYMSVMKEQPRIQTAIAVRVAARTTLPRRPVWLTTSNT